jgi:hypothetical protein
MLLVSHNTTELLLDDNADVVLSWAIKFVAVRGGPGEVKVIRPS